MKKSTIIFILLILFGRVYSQEDSMKFELPKLGLDYINIEVKLPKIEIRNKSLVKALMTNIVEEKYGKSGFYLLDIKEDKLKGYPTIIVTCHIIEDINNRYKGFFYIEGHLFVIKGDSPDGLYLIEQEKKTFEYREYLREGMVVPFAMFWDPPRWTFIYEKSEVKLLKCEYFN